jgi:hypothetical protein
MKPPTPIGSSAGALVELSVIDDVTGAGSATCAAVEDRSGVEVSLGKSCRAGGRDGGTSACLEGDAFPGVVLDEDPEGLLFKYPMTAKATNPRTISFPKASNPPPPVARVLSRLGSPVDEDLGLYPGLNGTRGGGIGSLRGVGAASFALSARAAFRFLKARLSSLPYLKASLP